MRVLSFIRHSSLLKFATVRHDPRNGGLSYFPDTIPMQNDRANGLPSPIDNGKGDVIHIESNWWHHIEKINSPRGSRGYKWARSIGNMWINLEYDIDTPYSTARAESLTCGGVLIAYTEETFTHVKLVSYDWRMSTVGLEENQFTHPHMYWKAWAINIKGNIIKVANELDVWFPRIAERDLWMSKKDLIIAN